MKSKFLFIFIPLSIILTACSSFGMGGGMMEDGHMDDMPFQIMEIMSEQNMELMQARHNMSIPEEYAGMTNTAPADEDSLAQGKRLYTALCASCHGTAGMSDSNLVDYQDMDPPPAPIALTSQMISDAYWFWRVSEGGIEFGTAMPAWKDVLTDENIWDLLNYVKSLKN